VGINLIVAVTDGDWFETLRYLDVDEVNFWSPSPRPFQALRPGELFLFKLHSPRNFIVGGGVFAHADEMPCSLAWEAFGTKNGANSLFEMRQRIAKYRSISAAERQDFRIGCRILTQPFFLNETEWLSVPSDWSPNIVSFKTYSTSNLGGLQLWDRVQRWLVGTGAGGFEQERLRFGEPYLVKPRLGQGAFRALVTDIYERRCAVTEERTLPALDAAHIKPYADGGEHEADNGILLRRDLHSLFDAGYVTIDEGFRFNVSSKIKEEFENGREYYALHGRDLKVPEKLELRPRPEFLRWHNEQRYLG
jgi:putative restriction endonuclease